MHRSAIVNIDQVEKLCTRHNGEYHLMLKNGQNLKVSRSYKDRIKQTDIELMKKLLCCLTVLLLTGCSATTGVSLRDTLVEWQLDDYGAYR